MIRARLALFALVLLLAVVLGATPALASHVRWHGGVYVGLGPLWWPPYYPYGWYPGPYYYGYPYGYPRVIVEQPQVYIEMPPAPPQYWYYCTPARAYYPSVETCAEPWIKVPAS